MMLARQVHRQHGASLSQRLISAAVTMKGRMSVAAPAATSTLTTTRSFGDRPLRGYPQYTTHGPDSMFALKVILPSFKIIKGDSIAVDMSKKGRLMVELTPRGNTGYLWTDQVRFALSCEEVGLLCSQLPGADVEFVRTPRQADYDNGGAGFNSDEPDKVLTVTPGEGESVIFTFDYRKDGNGGYSPSGVQHMDKGGYPRTYEVTAGEFKVVQSLMMASIPYLTGWNTSLEHGIESAVYEAKNPSGNDSRNSNVPF